MVQVFTDSNTFEAYNSACKWLASAGYSVGKIDDTSGLVGIKHGDFEIQKWKNLSTQDKAFLDGKLAGDILHGPLLVVIKEREK